MSYLRFRPLRFEPGDEFSETIFAWPVLAIPTRYWATVPLALDILEQAILALLKTGVRQPAELQRLLGIPTSMDNMIERALLQLQAQNYINDRLYLTQQGTQASVEDQAVKREFREGWLLFDQVRGGVFPYIHSGHLPFFKADKMDNFPIVTVPPQVLLPQEQELQQMGAAALAAYNYSVFLLAAMEEEADDYNTSDLNREFDQTVELPGSTFLEQEQIEDIELLPKALYEGHHLLVEVVGELLPGSTKVRLQAYSPFSTWEQARYLDTLCQLDIAQVKNGLADLNKRVRQAADEGMWSRVNGITGNVRAVLIKKIKDELGSKVALPELLIEELVSCEYLDYVVRRQDLAEQPLGQSTPLNRWGVLLETILTQVAIEVREFVVPVVWHKDFKNDKKAGRWYEDVVYRRGLSQYWLNLPNHFLSRVFRNAKASPTFGDIKTSSSSDILTKIILAGLSTKITEATPRTYKLLKMIEQEEFPFKDFAETAEWRNKASHTYGIQAINQLSDEKYLDRLSIMRTTNYSILKQIFAQ